MSKADPEQWSKWRREKHLKSFYGLTPEEYDLLVVSNNNLCGICNTKPNKLYVDHCHTSGNVRGLLCQQCNTMLGMAKDNITTLRNAIRYLEKNFNG